MHCNTANRRFHVSAWTKHCCVYVLLPSSLVSLPSSLFNVLHWALILGSALIAYRLLTVRPPYEETIAENIVKFYYENKNIPSKEYDKELGQIVGKALKKFYSPDPILPPPLTSPTNVPQDSSTTPIPQDSPNSLSTHTEDLITLEATN